MNIKKNLAKLLSIGILFNSINTNAFANELFSNVVSRSIENINNKMKLEAIENYNVYYGWEYTPEIVEEMKLYDLLILEPTEIESAERKQIKQDIQNSGTLIYGYMTATEISQWDDELLDLVTPEDYLYIDGEPYISWGNNVGDLRKESFRDKLIDLIGTRIVDGGYDGIFIDDLDNYESISNIGDQDLVDELLLSSIEFIEELKTTYPSLSIIQNRAFLTLDAGSKNYIDGFMYENFKTVEGDWYSRMKAIIDDFMSLGKKTVLAVVNSENEKDKLYNECIGYGWKFYCRPDDDYSTWHKYLNPQVSIQEIEAENKVLELESKVDSILSSEFEYVRELVNSLSESIKKDELQERLNSLAMPTDITLEKQTATANLDVYIKSENMLSLSLDTNSVTFEDYSGAEPLEKLSAVNITVSSSLPYDLNAYMPSEISNAGGTNKIDLNILNIRENTQSTYVQFENTDDKIILKENCLDGNNIVHLIDLKLDSSDAHVSDIYKTVIKFEAEQK